MKRDFIFDLFGVYFLLLGTIAFVNFFILYGIIPLWFSHITLLFIGIGILRRNAEIIAVQLNIIMIPSFLWSIDFFHQLIIGKQLLGITNYFFESFTGLLTLENFISLQHIYTSAVVLAFILFLGISRKDLWKWSLLEAFSVFLLIIIFISPEDNFNCVLGPCKGMINLFNGFHQLFWLVFMFVIIYAANRFVTKLAVKT